MPLLVGKETMLLGLFKVVGPQSYFQITLK